MEGQSLLFLKLVIRNHTQANFRFRSALAQPTRTQGMLNLMACIQFSIPTALITLATRKVTTAGASASTSVVAGALVAPRATGSSTGTSAFARGAAPSTGNRSKRPRLE